MPTTFSSLAPARRVAVGDCSGPLGSGFDALARSAYSALLAAEWTEDSSAPFLPVHDNGQTTNKSLPRGDAWKCSYGYDASARTERSACGAVCYTFALPADAVAGTPANVASVALSVTGDRYLDAGVDVYCVLSASDAPPSVSAILAGIPVGTYCATSGQAPVKPNERHGVTAAVSWEPTATPAQAFLHVALLLHDYTTNRGAWIEGGAMLDGAAATIEFSRDVAADSAGTVRILRQTREVENGGGQTVVASAFARGWYPYNYNLLNAAPTSDDAYADAIEIVRSYYAGKDVSAYLKWGYSTDDGEAAGFFSFAAGGTSLQIGGMYFLAPPVLPVGYTITAPLDAPANSGGGDFVAALVQTDSDPPVEYGESDMGGADAPAFDEVLFGDRGSIVAIGDGTVPAGSTVRHLDAKMTVVRPPAKKYLALVIVPRAAVDVEYETGRGGAVLLATPPA